MSDNDAGTREPTAIAGDEGVEQKAAVPISFESPHVLAAFTDYSWRAVIADVGATEDEREAAARTRSGLSDELASILDAETLVVLAGLGTSLGIPPDDGSRAPTMAALWDDVSALGEYEAVVSRLRPDLLASKNLEHVLSDAQARYAVAPEPELSDFIGAAEEVVLNRCSFVTGDTDVSAHELFLRKVARRSVRLQRTQLFTTNYDLAFETAARNARFYVIDGFGYSGLDFDGGSFDLDYVRRRPHEQLALEPNVFHLLKLHGSVDWTLTNGAVAKTSRRPTTPVLIYPSAAKYQLSYQQPYLEFMSRFQIALRQPDVGLIVVGFGFNDEHINAPIEAALRSNIGLRAAIVSPGVRSASRSEPITRIESLIEQGDRRLSMFTGTFDDLVKYLPEVPVREEREEHAQRMATVRSGSSR